MGKKTINHLREAPEFLTPEAMRRETQMSEAAAGELSQAWMDLARGLAEPAREGPLGGKDAFAMQTALEMAGKALDGAMQGQGQTLEGEALLGFPGRCHAAGAAARAMGFGAEQADALWALAFHMKVAERSELNAQRRLAERVDWLNERFGVSESLAWALAEWALMDALKSVCEEGNGPWRLRSAASECRKRLEALGGMAVESERPRRWLGERESGVIEAMGRVARLSLSPELCSGQAWDQARQEQEGVERGAEALNRMRSASERAEAEQKEVEASEAAPNVKRRRLG